MVYEAKNRAAKRKVENCQKEKSKKSTRLENPQEQLVYEHKTLKDKYEQLLVHHKANLEKIAVLNKKVLKYETEENNKQEAVSAETQTSMKCEDCGYPSDDLVDFGEHLYQCHGPDNENVEESIICYLCGWKLKSKRELMVHRKEKHLQSVRMCLFYSKGDCDFSDEDCWYQHKTQESSLAQPLKEFKCSLCGQTFNFKPDFMKHRKTEHPNNISFCKTYNNGTCNFGSEKCWYKHVEKQTEVEEIDDNNEMITRLFDMMEKFAERFELIENQL